MNGCYEPEYARNGREPFDFAQAGSGTSGGFVLPNPDPRASCNILRIDSSQSREDNWPAAVVGTPLFNLVVRIF